MQSWLSFFYLTCHDSIILFLSFDISQLLLAWNEICLAINLSVVLIGHIACCLPVSHTHFLPRTPQLLPRHSSVILKMDVVSPLKCRYMLAVIYCVTTQRAVIWMQSLWELYMCLNYWGVLLRGIRDVHVARMWEGRSFGRKPEGERPLGRCGHRWEDNFSMDIEGKDGGVGLSGSE